MTLVSAALVSAALVPDSGLARLGRRLIGALVVLTALLPLVACNVNPTTGERQFTGLVPVDQEAAIGAEEHPKVLAQFGGPYRNPRVQSFVERTGQRLAAVAGQSDSRYTFTVLDTDTVNAFALPGGYVYITRGLLALANDEAEVAGVLAHEIGHVAARHSAERISRQTLTGLLVAGLGAVIGSPELAQALDIGAALALTSFSREQELEADALGVRTIAAAGYDPFAVPRFLETMRRDAQLRGAASGTGGGEGLDFFATHPRTEDRVEKAVVLARDAGPAAAQARRGRDELLAALDGMVYGDSPQQGFVRGNAFIHPQFGFRFEAPAGFRLINGEDKVMATGPGDALFVFDGDPVRGSGSMIEYLTRVWAPDVSLANVEAITINGLPAATGTAQATTRRGPVDLRLVAIRFAPDQVYRFAFITPETLTRRLDPAERAIANSFRRLQPEEIARFQPLRIRVVPVRPGDTVESLAARMPPADGYSIERFRVLNDFPPGTPLQPGQMVKVIVE